MSRLRYILLAISFTFVLQSCNNDKRGTDDLTTPENAQVRCWITTPDKSKLLTEVTGLVTMSDQPEVNPLIVIDTTQTFQTIDGFGFALTGGSAMLLNQKLSAGKRDSVLNEVFSTNNNGIGVSYIRVSIGASDLDEKVFSYSDLPKGQTDQELKTFSMKEDEKDLIPVLQQIVRINPNIKIMGSPWSAPAWMKDNGSPIGGMLLPKYYPAYAKYFVRYIQEMKAHGINIHAITIQNEPENPGNNPSMVMTAEQQSEFIKHHLGPAFEAADIHTQIIVFDHNCDHPEYPIKVLNDPDSKKYIDGSAFHLYLGEIDALSKVHEAHPDKNIYFTEQWTSPSGTFSGDLLWHTSHLTIGATRNWSKNVLEWNLAADPQFNPHTDKGGCTSCMGALTVDENQVSRNVSYYIIGHASRFVPPGSVRIGTMLQDGLANVAFKRPDGLIVLIMANEKELKQVGIRLKNKTAVVSLPAGAVATVVLRGGV